MIKAVILDLDGTLLHTLPDLVAGANGMLQEFGFTALPSPVVGEFVGKGAADLVRRCLLEFIAPDQALALHARAFDSFQQHYSLCNGKEAAVYPGVIEGLNAFQFQGLRLACVTNKPYRFTPPLLAKTGLISYFEVILGGDSLPNKKPLPDQLLWVSQALQLSPSEVLAIGDSSNDALASRAAGMLCHILPYGYNHGEPVDGIACDGIVQSIEASAKLIASMI